MATIKVVMSDVDGTILNFHHQISNNLKNEVKKLTAKGIPFVLASARSPEGMKQISRELALESVPLVAFNGALILKEATTIFTKPLEKYEVMRILTLLAAHFPNIGINLYSENNWYVNKVDEHIKGESKITQLTPKVADLASLAATVPVHKLLLIASEAEISAAYEFLTPQVTTSALYLSKENYLEITHRAVSKAEALRKIAAYYQITCREIMAFGDNYNDLPMLKAAGIGIAMANAPLTVKKAADKVTKTNDEDGVASVLAKLQ